MAVMLIFAMPLWHTHTHTHRYTHIASLPRRPLTRACHYNILAHRRWRSPICPDMIRISSILSAFPQESAPLPHRIYGRKSYKRNMKADDFLNHPRCVSLHKLQCDCHPTKLSPLSVSMEILWWMGGGNLITSEPTGLGTSSPQMCATLLSHSWKTKIKSHFRRWNTENPYYTSTRFRRRL